MTLQRLSFLPPHRLAPLRPMSAELRSWTSATESKSDTTDNDLQHNCITVTNDFKRKRLPPFRSQEAPAKASCPNSNVALGRLETFRKFSIPRFQPNEHQTSIYKVQGTAYVELFSRADGVHRRVHAALTTQSDRDNIRTCARQSLRSRKFLPSRRAGYQGGTQH